MKYTKEEYFALMKVMGLEVCGVTGDETAPCYVDKSGAYDVHYCYRVSDRNIIVLDYDPNAPNDWIPLEKYEKT